MAQLRSSRHRDLSGRARGTVRDEVYAAEVAASTPRGVTADLAPFHRHLTEIHAAPRWLWSALVEWLVDEKKPTVEATSRLVKQLGKLKPPPAGCCTREYPLNFEGTSAQN